jgi:MFS family permease
MGRLVWMSAAAFGLSLVAFSASTSFWLSSALMVPAGYAIMVEMAAVNSLIQAMVPDRLRGRVMAVYSMMIMGMAPFGALISGFLAQAFGAPAAVRIGGIACIAGAAVFAVRWPSYRVQARDLIVAQGATIEPTSS